MIEMDFDRRRSNRIAFSLLGVIAGMAGLSLAAVPFFRLFCEVTGYAGTPRILSAAQFSAAPPAGVMAVRFNTDVGNKLGWRFQPKEREISIAMGQPALAIFRAKNLMDETVTGTATYNVTPMKAARYIGKVECFCFTRQTLAPGQEAELPVSFVIDPAIATDPETRDVAAVTLSYTFFPAKQERLIP
jgi:cytochrome c oxidase assembly protein subunit 11